MVEGLSFLLAQEYLDTYMYYDYLLDPWDVLSRKDWCRLQLTARSIHRDGINGAWRLTTAAFAEAAVLFRTVYLHVRRGHNWFEAARPLHWGHLDFTAWGAQDLDRGGATIDTVSEGWPQHWAPGNIWARGRVHISRRGRLGRIWCELRAGIFMEFEFINQSMCFRGRGAHIIFDVARGRTPVDQFLPIEDDGFFRGERRELWGGVPSGVFHTFTH